MLIIGNHLPLIPLMNQNSLDMLDGMLTIYVLLHPIKKHIKI